MAERTAPPDANGCTLWTGATQQGYGYIGIGSRKLRAHRVALALALGLDPDALPSQYHALHGCDVKRCVNPAHLTLGTHTENMRQAGERGQLSARQRRVVAS